MSGIYRNVSEGEIGGLEAVQKVSVVISSLKRGNDILPESPIATVAGSEYDKFDRHLAGIVKIPARKVKSWLGEPGLDHNRLFYWVATVTPMVTASTTLAATATGGRLRLTVTTPTTGT